MRKTLTIAAGLLAFTAATAQAEPRIYAYHAENFCPAGLQPITIDGVICCGTPNQSTSYQSMKQTPVVKRKKHVKRHSHVVYDVDPGVKGVRRSN